MNRSALAEELSESHDITKTKAKSIIDHTLESIVSSVSDGEDVKFGGFGRFESVERASRKGHNPQTGEPMQIPAKVVPKFRPYKAFKESVEQ